MPDVDEVQRRKHPFCEPSPIGTHAPVPPAHELPGNESAAQRETQYPSEKPRLGGRQNPPVPQSVSRWHVCPTVPVTTGVMHAPETHVWLALHVRLQAPQWVMLFVTSVHTPLHTIAGGGHGVTHVPLWQSWPALQALLQRPQCVGSTDTSVQLAPHIIRGAGHVVMHDPALHT